MPLFLFPKELIMLAPRARRRVRRSPVALVQLMRKLEQLCFFLRQLIAGSTLFQAFQVTVRYLYIHSLQLMHFTVFHNSRFSRTHNVNSTM
jgi:hypothetical protein